MSRKYDAFSLTMTKVSADRNDKPSYLSQMVTLAPAAGIQAGFDFPRGYVDKAIEAKITGRKLKPRERGFGRMGGRFGASMVTTPLFLSGIKDLKNAKTKEEKQKGTAKLIAAGATYGAIKGGLEKGIESGSWLKGIKKIKDVATVRGILSAGAAVGTASTIAKGLKKPKKGKSNTMERFVLPTAAGAAIGGLKGGIESAYVNRKNFKSFIKQPKKLLGAVGGRAAAGALGAVVLSEIAKKTMSKVAYAQHIVNAKDELEKNNFFDSPGDLYYKTKVWASNKPDVHVRSAFGDTIRRGAERSPSSRAVYYALHDTLSSRGYELPKPKMRDKVISPEESTKADVTTLVAASLLAPNILEGVLSTMEPDKRDVLVRDALDSMAATNGIDVYDTADKKFWDKVGLNPSIGAHTYVHEGKKYIAASKGRPEIMAHELGHALSSGPLSEFLQSKEAKKLFNYGKMINILVPAAVIATSSDRSFSTPEEISAKKEFLVGAGVVGTALMAPVLTEEASASIKALKYLTRANMKADIAQKGTANLGNAILKSTKAGAKLLPAFGTYAAAAAVPLVVAKYLQRGLKDDRDV